MQAPSLAHTYSNLLKLYGFDEDEGGEETRAEKTRHADQAPSSGNGSFSELKISDAAHIVLTEQGPMTSREILNEFESRGKPIDSKHDLTILATAIRRDDRFSKRHDKWRVRRARRRAQVR